MFGDRIKVGKQSWHYRLNRKIFDFSHSDMPKSLCGYFWMTVLALVISFAIVLLSPVVALIVGFVFLIHFVSDKVDNFSAKRRAKRGHKGPKPPSLVVEYVKAKKNEHCPLIEYV